MTGRERKKTCDVCGGTGQVSYFKGASRFLLSTEECDACAGTGVRLQGVGQEKEIIRPESATPAAAGRKKK